MQGDLVMNNNRITRIPEPQLTLTHAATANE